MNPSLSRPGTSLTVPKSRGIAGGVAGRSASPGWLRRLPTRSVVHRRLRSATPTATSRGPQGLRLTPPRIRSTHPGTGEPERGVSTGLPRGPPRPPVDVRLASSPRRVLRGDGERRPATGQTPRNNGTSCPEDEGGVLPPRGGHGDFGLRKASGRSRPPVSRPGIRKRTGEEFPGPLLQRQGFSSSSRHCYCDALRQGLRSSKFSIAIPTSPRVRVRKFLRSSAPPLPPSPLHSGLRKASGLRSAPLRELRGRPLTPAGSTRLRKASVADRPQSRAVNGLTRPSGVTRGVRGTNSASHGESHG